MPIDPSTLMAALGRLSRQSAASLAAFLFATVAIPANALAPRTLLLDGAFAGPDIVAVGERGTIIRSVDHALTWETVAAVTTATLTGVAFAEDGKHGWAVGHDALILATTDAGRSWHKQWQGSNLSDSFLDVLVLTPTDVIAVGAYGLFLRSADGGQVVIV